MNLVVGWEHVWSQLSVGNKYLTKQFNGLDGEIRSFDGAMLKSFIYQWPQLKLNCWRWDPITVYGEIFIRKATAVLSPCLPSVQTRRTMAPLTNLKANFLWSRRNNAAFDNGWDATYQVSWLTHISIQGCQLHELCHCSFFPI